MKIHFTLEDTPDGRIDANSIRTDIGTTIDTPAHRLAKELEQKIHAYMAKEKQIRGKACLH